MSVQGKNVSEAMLIMLHPTRQLKFSANPARFIEIKHPDLDARSAMDVTGHKWTQLKHRGAVDANEMKSQVF
jgi:hypothetical protein